MRIEVDPLDMIGKHIIANGVYEPDTVAFIREALRPGMTFVDVGANVGQYSLIASERVGPTGRVHAFEPHPTMFEVLRRNLDRNGCTNVVVQSAAVGAADGVAVLAIGRTSNYGATSLATGSFGGKDVLVPMVSLDSYCAQCAIERIDVMKIDIEGAELPALEGARAMLRASKDLVIVIEVSEVLPIRLGLPPTGVLDFLRDMGFCFYRFADGQLVGYERRASDPPSFNLVATRSESAPRLPAEDRRSIGSR